MREELCGEGGRGERWHREHLEGFHLKNYYVKENTILYRAKMLQCKYICYSTTTRAV